MNVGVVLEGCGKKGKAFVLPVQLHPSPHLGS